MIKNKIISVSLLAGLLFTGVATAGVNVNTANAKQLQKLNGVGTVTAKAIIKDRKANGRYDSMADLKRVDGIGSKTIDGFKKQAEVGSDSGA